jgi:hypothetical protein
MTDATTKFFAGKERQNKAGSITMQRLLCSLSSFQQQKHNIYTQLFYSFPNKL